MKMENKNVWVFEFGLQAEAPHTVSRIQAESLMAKIIAWAEESNLLVGGGFRAPTKLEDTPVGPDYPAEGLFPLRPEN